MAANGELNGDRDEIRGRNFDRIKHEIADDVLAMQKPSQLLALMTYGLSLYAAVRLCIEAGVFSRLVESHSPLTAKQLAIGIGGNPKDQQHREEFIVRLMRSASGLNLVDEVAESTYLANELTETMAEPGFASGIMFMYRNLAGPDSTMSQLVSWATEHAFTAPVVASDGPYQRARGIVGTSTFANFSDGDPKSIALISKWMHRIQQDRLNWTAWFPSDLVFDSPSAADDLERVFMVDVGGGIGHDLDAFASKYPDRKMQLVLQDTPEVIAKAREQKLDSRIEVMDHDFFSPQPVKGAKLYFLHKVMHDWPDSQCIEILMNIRGAMAPDSRIFLNDTIIPGHDTPLLSAALDTTMLALFGGKERSRAMWERLIAQVGGLSIKKFWQAPGIEEDYDNDEQPQSLQGEGIIEIVKTEKLSLL